MCGFKNRVVYSRTFAFNDTAATVTKNIFDFVDSQLPLIVSLNCFGILPLVRGNPKRQCTAGNVSNANKQFVSSKRSLQSALIPRPHKYIQNALNGPLTIEMQCSVP